MLTIDVPRHGAILNRHDGAETADGLTICITGTRSGNDPVTVNGIPADCHAKTFSANLTLTARHTLISAHCGAESTSVAVLYDRNSFKRYRFSLDDNIWFLRDIARQRYSSIFDNPYMALWKKLHDAYGTKINCNIYFQCEGFDLTMMPDTYKSEWQDNAHWFRMTFHALQNEPSEPYINAGYDQLTHDFDLVTDQIVRFAGEAVTNTFTTIHWGEATRQGCRAVRDRGIVGLCGYFHFNKQGVPKVSYYADSDLTAYMSEHDYWMDFDEGLFFIRHDMVINSVAFSDIVPLLEKTAANPQQRDVMELMIHEQYFDPGFVAYLPDYAERCETAVRWMAENGYTPVFWSEGFLGVPESAEKPATMPANGAE